MTPEETKLADARAILEEMRREDLQMDRDAFRRRASGFLNTARTVMLYIRERAREQKRLDWFREMDDGSEWCCRLRTVRNKDVHDRPFNPLANHFVALRETIGVSDTLREGTLTRFDEDGQTLVMQPTESERKPVNRSGDGVVSQSTEYLLEVEGERLPLLECFEAYLDELAANIEKARGEGIIEG